MRTIDLITMVSAMAVIASRGVALELGKPTANLTEKWSDAAGWTSNFSPDASLASAGWTNETLGAVFQGLPAMSLPSPQKVYLVATTNASGGRFSGDFSKIDSVEFDISIINSPSVVFYFKSATGVTWNRKITNSDVNTTSGQWSHVCVAFKYGTNWNSYVSSNQVPNFDTDKILVDEVGFRITRDIGVTMTANNNAVIDNLKLVGPYPMVSETDSPPIAWLMENNISSNDIDTDHDGYSNMQEFLAGTDPNNSNDFFRVEIGHNNVGKPVLKWKNSNYKAFDVMQSSDLSLGFTVVTNEAKVVGANREMEVNSDSSQVRFYRVGVRQMP